MTSNYTLYSDKKNNRHIFMRTEADGKQTIISSEEVNLYNENYGQTMDLHHGLIRFMFEIVDNSDRPRTTDDDDRMESILRVPFDKFKELK